MEQLHKLMVKGMVCSRCISTVAKALESAGISAAHIKLGEVLLPAFVESSAIDHIEAQLKPYGFSVLLPKDACMVARIKQLVANVYSGQFDFPHAFRFAAYAQKELDTDYKRLSSMFSSKEGLTLEKYILDYRIDKVKEWLVYTDHSIEDLAFRFGFSSTAHLSRQFKQLTGLNASHFRDIRRQKQLA